MLNKFSQCGLRTDEGKCFLNSFVVAEMYEAFCEDTLMDESEGGGAIEFGDLDPDGELHLVERLEKLVDLEHSYSRY